MSTTPPPVPPDAAPDADAAPLRTLARNQQFRRWAVCNLFARLPLTMNLLALVLLGERLTGSLAVGAILSGIATAASGLSAQWRGRRLDRVELRSGLRTDLVLSAAAVGAVTAAAAAGAPIWVLGILVAVQGVVSAAVLGAFRTLLIPSVRPGELEAANALDAVFVEVAFVAGPALAGILALLVGPIGVLGLMATAFLVSAVLLRWLPTRPPADDRHPPGPNPLRTRGATAVYALVFAVGLPLGAWEASIPARLESFGMEPASAGPLLALTALGSALGGIVAAGMSDPLRRGRLRGAALLIMFGLLMLPTAVASDVVILGVALFAVGLPIAPLNALAGLAFQRTVAEPRQAEGFALYPAMILIGAGIGQSLAGAGIALAGPRLLIFLLSLVPLGLGVVVAGAAWRRHLAGLPAGVGFGHDPTIRDPASYSNPPVGVAKS